MNPRTLITPFYGPFFNLPHAVISQLCIPLLIASWRDAFPSWLHRIPLRMWAAGLAREIVGVLSALLLPLSLVCLLGVHCCAVEFLVFSSSPVLPLWSPRLCFVAIAGRFEFLLLLLCLSNCCSVRYFWKCCPIPLFLLRDSHFFFPHVTGLLLLALRTSPVMSLTHVTLPCLDTCSSHWIWCVSSGGVSAPWYCSWEMFRLTRRYPVMLLVVIYAFPFSISHKLFHLDVEHICLAPFIACLH